MPRRRRVREYFPSGGALRSLIRDLADAQGGRCVYCGRLMTFDDPRSRLYATREHKIPVHRGGREARDNYAASCRQCNNAKGQLTHDEYVAFRERNGRSR